MEDHGLTRARALTERFKSLAERLARLVEAEGVTLIPYVGAGPSHFASLPNDKKEATLAHFQRYVEIFAGAVDHGISVKDDRKLLWRAFGAFRMRPLSDLMTYTMDEEDVVEIYDRDAVQIFRNMQFFRLCSYSLDDVISRPFYELYRRETDVTYKLLLAASEVLTGKSRATYWLDLPLHRLDEIDSPRHHRLICENRFLSPLHVEDGSVAGFVSVLRIAAIDKGLKNKKSDQP